MNELIMPHNVGVKNALENMKEVLALYKKVIGNYRPLLDGERYITDKEVAQSDKVSQGQVIDILIIGAFFNPYSLQYYSFWKGKIGIARTVPVSWTTPMSIASVTV